MTYHSWWLYVREMGKRKVKVFFFSSAGRGVRGGGVGKKKREGIEVKI